MPCADKNNWGRLGTLFAGVWASVDNDRAVLAESHNTWGIRAIGGGGSGYTDGPSWRRVRHLEV